MCGEIFVSLQLFLAFHYVTLVRGNETFKSFLICFLCASAILFIEILIVCTELLLKAKTRLGDMKNEVYLMNIPLSGKKLGSHMMQSFLVYILSFRHDIFAFATHGILFYPPQIHYYFLTSQCFAGYWLSGYECVLSSRKFVMLCRNLLPSLSGYKTSFTEKSYFSTLILIPFCYICHVIET